MNICQVTLEKNTYSVIILYIGYIVFERIYYAHQGCFYLIKNCLNQF